MAKPRPRKLKGVDPKLTEYLNIDELAAIGGDKYQIKAMGRDKTVPACIECGGPTVNHGRFDKVLIDIIQVDRQKQFARLHYYFYKYRCLNEVEGHENCNTLFQKQLGFVSSDNAKITCRYENEIMRLAMYESLTDVRADMKDYIVGEHKRDLISKPAMSKLIKRWVDERDEKRSFGSPMALLLYTYRSFYNAYIVIGGIYKNTCRIIEVLPSISEGEIRGFFAKVDTRGLMAVVTDCEPTLHETVKDLIPESKVMIDIDAVRRVLKKEFADYVNERLKRYQKIVRELFLKAKEEQREIDIDDQLKMHRIQKDDPELESAYTEYTKMDMLLRNHRDVPELRQWEESLNDRNSEIFVLTKSYLQTYYLALARYYKVLKSDGGSIYDEIFALNRRIETHFPISTNEVFRARMLYSDFGKTVDDKWQGIDVSDLRDIIDKMINEGGLKEHER